MAGITGTSGFSQPIWPKPADSARTQPTQAPQPAKKTTFVDMLEKAVSGVDGDQQKAAQAIEDLVTNRVSDPLPVVTAVAKADMSFKLLVGVRNKMVEAYKQTMNMQI